MNKFLNFSTILCSYILITLLVISCGDGGEASSNNDVNNGTSQPDNQPDDTGDQYSSDSGDQPDDTGDQHSSDSGDQSDDTGDISGGQGSAGSNSKVVQADLNDKTCLLSDRDDKDAVVAVLCQTDSFIGLITKTTPAGQEAQQINFLIPSTDNAGGTPSRTWDLSKGAKIQISYNKDYTLTVDGSIGDIAQAVGHTAEFPLQNLTIASLLNDTKEALRSGGITFSLASGSAIKVAIAPKLAVKTQADFISMGSVVSIPDLTQTDYKVPFVLENDLNLVAPGGEGAKFDNSIIPVAEKAFDFDGGGYTISLNSEIDAVANDKPAAIIGEIKKASNLQNFTLNVNQPISGTEYVSTIIANASSGGLIQNIKININGSLSLYKPNVYSETNSYAYVGGVLGKSCADINNVVVKTVADAVIQAHVADDRVIEYWYYPETYYVGGLVAAVNCSTTINVVKSNNLVDVTLGSFASDNSKGNTLEANLHVIGGFVAYVGRAFKLNMNNNLVRLSISRGNNLPTDFTFYYAAGFVGFCTRLTEVTNNLVYVDFSNLGSVSYLGGLFGLLREIVKDNIVTDNNIANNMVFIADGFTGSEVLFSFGAAIRKYYLSNVSYRSLDIANIFVSSPVTDEQYNHSNLSSFVHQSRSHMDFNYLILDNKDAAVMFKAGDEAANLRGKVGGTNGVLLSTLAEAKTTPIGTLFSAGNTSWEEGSQGYPQLKAPADFSEAKKADWDRINGLIQTGLADRAAKNQ